MKKLTYVFAVLLVFGMLAARPAHAQLSNSEIQSLLATLIAQVQELQRQLLVLQQENSNNDTFVAGKPAIKLIEAKAAGEGEIYAGEKAYIHGTGLSGKFDVLFDCCKPRASATGWGTSDVYGEFVVPAWSTDGERVAIIVSNGEESSEPYYVTIRVAGSTDKKSLNVTYPKGGEKFEAGDKVSITWDSRSIIANEPLELRLKSPSCATTNYLLAAGIKNNGSYTWEVSEDLVSEKCDYNIFLMVSNVKSSLWTSSESGAFQIVR